MDTQLPCRMGFRDQVKGTLGSTLEPSSPFGAAFTLFHLLSCKKKVKKEEAFILNSEFSRNVLV